jgi:hypothetical protein
MKLAFAIWRQVQLDVGRKTVFENTSGTFQMR